MSKHNIKWIKCTDRLPTESDADDVGDIFYSNHGMLFLTQLPDFLAKDLKTDKYLNCYWARTGFKYADESK